MIKIGFNIIEQIIQEDIEELSSDDGAEFEILDNDLENDVEIKVDNSEHIRSGPIYKNVTKVKMNAIIWLNDNPIDIDEHDTLWIIELKKGILHRNYIHNQTNSYDWSYSDFLKCKKYIQHPKQGFMYIFITISTNEIPIFYQKLLSSLGSKTFSNSYPLYGWYCVYTYNQTNKITNIFETSPINSSHFKNNPAINQLIHPIKEESNNNGWIVINEFIYPALINNEPNNNCMKIIK